MHKQLITNKKGIQELKTFLHPTGSYYNLDRVIWDTRKDGEFNFDPTKIGGYQKRDGELVFSQAAKDNNDVLIAALPDPGKATRDLKATAANSKLSPGERLDALASFLGIG